MKYSGYGRLLIDPTHSLDRPHVVGVLGQQKPGMRALHLAVDLLFFLGLLQRLDLGFS